MSKDPSPSNSLIDGINANDSSRSELIDAIEILKEEIVRLKNKIKEQEKMLQKEKSIIKEEFDGPDDIEILKEMIISQRNALNEKEKELESIRGSTRLLDKYQKENEELKTFQSQITDAKSTIDNLMNELEMHKTNEENAKELIMKLNEEKRDYEENEKEALQFIEDLSEKNEKYKSKVKILEKKLEDIANTSIENKSSLINEFESEKEDLTIQNVNYVNKINELQNLIDNFNEKERKYEDKIKKLEEKLDYVKLSAIEEVSEFDVEREKLVNDYESKLKHLDNKIKNMEGSFGEIKISLEAEKNKYKKRIIELQKEIQILIKTGDQKIIENKLNLENLELEDGSNYEIKRPKTIIEREEIANKEENLIDEGISVEKSNSDLEILSREIDEINPKDTISNIEPLIDSVRKCPKCGNQRKSLIREELDKTNIIMAYPRMYGKKFVCGAFGCGCNWRIKNNKIEIL